ncbi:ATP-binding cassette domain-containing protein [Bifidobacterium thermacidophilum]|uniref:ABC transporter ATP-binding protein n=1 Tax=Bifidobacterium thermacidophilum subsp. thermacidophilum TaxID=79262 RepID=A0A087EAQ4_9BIFI|nr:ATP-binding cassette domain-containing protein [Bifidobacterium thermacidophilum]KFJ04855.1 ABC transporter ATP-binding protein [Bifidobacterium thermacidophilum subsp. thermacidophilum]
MSENNEPTKADQIEQLDESTESVQFSVVIDDTADDADLDTADTATADETGDAAESADEQAAHADADAQAENANADAENASKATLDATAAAPASDKTAAGNTAKPKISAAAPHTRSARTVAHADTATRASSHIDRELRQRRHITLKAYPSFAFNNVILSNRKTGRDVLDNISMDCYIGRTYAIMVDPDDAEQRAGFMAVASGMVFPTSGRVRLKSSDLASFDPAEARAHRLGVVPQRYAIRDDLDAIANLVYTMDASGRNFLQPKPDIARDLLDQTGFGDGSDLAVENYEALVHTPAGKLREIDRRRLAIARAICCEAEVLLLDEPTGGLDKEGATTILDLLNKLAHPNRRTADSGRCVIIVTDNDDVADACDEAFTLYD